MAYRQFLIPEYHEFIDVIGAAPEPVEGEEVQRLKVEADGETMVIMLDVAGRSVHCTWSRGVRVLSEIFQEGATLLRVEKSGKGAHLGIDLETDSSKGQLLISISPEFAIRSQTLLR